MKEKSCLEWVLLGEDGRFDPIEHPIMDIGVGDLYLAGQVCAQLGRQAARS